MINSNFPDLEIFFATFPLIYFSVYWLCKNDLIDDDNCSRQPIQILAQLKSMFNTVMLVVSSYNWISWKSMKNPSCPSVQEKIFQVDLYTVSRLLYHVKKWQRYAILRRKQFPVSSTRSTIVFLTFDAVVHCVLRLLEGLWLQDALKVA